MEVDIPTSFSGSPILTSLCDVVELSFVVRTLTVQGGCRSSSVSEDKDKGRWSRDSIKWVA